MSTLPPAAKRLTDAQIAAAARRLQQERNRLWGVLEALGDATLHSESQSESTAELAPSSQHLADIATETFERERDLTMLSDVRDEIYEVERALERLAAGRYGLCDWCSEPIPAERLEAIPAARFCLRHEERFELGGPHMNDLEASPEVPGAQVAPGREALRPRHHRRAATGEEEDFLATDRELDQLGSRDEVGPATSESLLPSEVAAMHIHRENELAAESESSD